MIPPPRSHRHTHAGVFAPHNAWRHLVAASADPDAALTIRLHCASKKMGLSEQFAFLSVPFNSLSSPLSSLFLTKHLCFSYSLGSPPTAICHVGKILSFMRRIFSNAAEGPEFYKARGAKRGARPQIVAGSGCIILGLFLVLGIVYLGVLAAEHPVAGGGAAAILAALIIYYVMVKKAQKRKISALRDEEFNSKNKNEAKRLASLVKSLEGKSGAELPKIIKEKAIAKLFAAFTVSIVDYRKGYHYLCGESMWVFDGEAFSPVYVFLTPTDEHLKGNALRERVQPLFDKFHLKKTMAKIEEIKPLPFDAHEFHLSWYLS